MNDFIRDINTIKEQNDLDGKPIGGPSNLKKTFDFIWEVAKVVIISLAIIIPVRMFVVQPFIVEGASMLPNFHDGEYLVVDEISYRFSDIQRGDVVIFRPPNHPTVYYIKRVIGLPGESVEIKDGSIYIYDSFHQEGIKLSEEDYLVNPVYIPGDKSKVTLGDNEYYLVGDNRGNSLDSRSFGPVEVERIQGKVFLRALPLDRFSFFKTPVYNFN
ncbi:signal peptidase I [Patescibacteria group bacterium]|nr:signal peptidase I [Patescibacteria group bacterium]